MNKFGLSILICIGLFSTVMSREANLINNAAFKRGLAHWYHSGAGDIFLGKNGIELSGGKLIHYLDLGNLEHADPQCGMPCNRKFRFRILAKGCGSIRLFVRARIMKAGNAVEFIEYKSQLMELDSDFRNFDFEAAEHDPEVVFHDKIGIEYSGSGKALIKSTSFYYLNSNGAQISFCPEAAVCRPGDKLTVKIHAAPETKLCCDLYPGQTLLGGYEPMKRTTVRTDANGEAEFSFIVPYAVQEGARLAVSDPDTHSKNSFFATVLPEKKLAGFRELGNRIKGVRHLLFLGDSLTDYDRGRNYVSMAHACMPESVTIRNAGVGGDTLDRILKRLTGGKINRPEMYENLFSPIPDTIFLLCGANDTKADFQSGFQKNVTPIESQPKLLESIIVFLKKHCPQAKIVLITIPPSYYPYQKALSDPLAQAGVNHNFFGLEQHVKPYNEMLKKFAAANGISVIDFAESVRADGDQQRLYVPDDGVHLSLKGHELCAELVLKYFGGY